MAFTQSDIDALERAIADGRGARSMTIGDLSVTFHSVQEMQELLGMMRRDVNATTQSTTTRLAATSKGF